VLRRSVEPTLESGHSVAAQYLSLWADCVAKLDEEQIANKNKQ
jgi:hypothetical protein